MFQLIDRPDTQLKDHQPAVELTRILIYRGLTYEVPQHPVSARTPEEISQLIGKHLIYRGTTYKIVPASPSTVLESKTPQKLCYRGVTYWSNPKTTSSSVEYAVV